MKPPIEDVPEAIVQESEYYMSKLCHKMEQQAAEQEDGYVPHALSRVSPFLACAAQRNMPWAS